MTGRDLGRRSSSNAFLTRTTQKRPSPLRRDFTIAPDLRRWYGHHPDRFEEFAEKYREELGRSPAAEIVDHLLDVAAERPVVLLTATRDVAISGARVLLDHLASAAKGR